MVLDFTSLSDSFLYQCKANSIQNITPSNQDSKSTREYKRIVEISNEYFERNLYEDFIGFFQESQYLIPLWAAHMLIEYGNPPDEIKDQALKVIERYCDNPLAPEVAKEERLWLHNYKKKLFGLLSQTRI